MRARDPAAILASGLLLGCTVALCAQPAAAQDGFGAAPRPQQPQQQYDPQQQGQQQDNTQQKGQQQDNPQQTSETQDFGIPPQAQLRATQQLHGPTPTSIPGGKVIDTPSLARLLQDRQSGVLLFHVLGSLQHLPGAIPVAPAGQGGGFDDQVQREFGKYLQQAVQGNQTRPMVFYCSGVQCWMSYNAALRAMKMGYRNVLWYRGGLDAWQQAGLPVQTEQPPVGQQGQPPAQGRR